MRITLVKIEEGKPNEASSSASEIITSVAEEICDHFCRYSDTADENYECDHIRAGNRCPLDRLI